MTKIVTFLLSVAAAVSTTDSSYTETDNRFIGITESEYGNIVLLDDLDLLDESEEKNIYFTIVDAVKTKDISIGVISNPDVSVEAADYYYSIISEYDTDFALMLFNENDYSYYFYGSTETEFANADEEFWMTNAYMDEKHYFVGGLQFALDIQYHTISETTPEETTPAETTDNIPDDSFTEMAENGIHTVKLENGHTVLLHDLDDSLETEEEAVILTDLMEAVRDKNFSIGILITDDVGEDKSDYGIMDFTDIYYEQYCGMDTDGVLLLINNDNKYDWLTTSGRCIDVFYGKDDKIFDALYDYLVDGNYNYACQRFVQEVKLCSEESYDDYDNDFFDDYHISGTISFSSDDFEGLISLVLICGIFAITGIAIFSGIINNSYKMKKNVTAANYKLINSLVFSQKTDTFIRTYTTRRTVSSSSSGSRSGSRSRSGGSRSHRSSSGGRHGGGGRRR